MAGKIAHNSDAKKVKWCAPITSNVSSYKALLEKIAKSNASRGHQMQPPASEKEIELLRKESKSKLGYALGKEHEIFLRLHNGFNFNGYSIYATKISPIAGYNDRFIDGFIEANLQYHEAEGFRKYIFFGQTGGALYVYDKTSKVFAEIDSVSTDAYEKFKTFDGMVTHILKLSLM